MENILKRRPLKINKPQKVASPGEIDEIKENAVSFLTDIKIIELYMEYLESLPDDAEPSHNLNHALYSSMNYTNRALDRTRSTQRYIFGDAQISLLELFNNLYDVILEAIDLLPQFRQRYFKKVFKEFDDFLLKHNDYLTQQK